MRLTFFRNTLFEDQNWTQLTYANRPFILTITLNCISHKQTIWDFHLKIILSIVLTMLNIKIQKMLKKYILRLGESQSKTILTTWNQLVVNIFEHSIYFHFNQFWNVPFSEELSPAGLNGQFCTNGFIPETILTLGPPGPLSNFFAAASKNQLGPIWECPPHPHEMVMKVWTNLICQKCQGQLTLVKIPHIFPSWFFSSVPVQMVFE